MSNLQAALKNIQKKFGESVVKIGVDDLALDGVLSLSSPTLDYAVYGGIPEGRIVEFSGAEGSGKTTTAFMVAGSYQKTEIERSPDNPRAIILLDNEGTADPIWAKKLGYDMDEDADVKTIIIRPEGQSAEEVFDIALDLLKTGEVGLMIFDSISTLVPMQIADESQTKHQMGGIAKALTRFVNTAMGLLRKYKATLIAINQVRENLSGYGDFLQTPGGRAWKHACSLRLMFKRGDFFDEEGNTLKKGAQSPAGHIVEMAVLKTKVSKWDRKVGHATLNYTRGIDVVEDTITLAAALGYVHVAGSWFSLIDPDTGEVMLDENGKPVKVQGKPKLKIEIEKRPVVFKRMYTAVQEELKKKDDAYVNIFAQLMDDANMFEKFGVTEEHIND